MSEERGLICVFCGKGFGYAGKIPTEATLKAACDHEAQCVHNPYKAEIKRLEARCKELEVEVATLKCCGNCKHFGIDDQHSLYCENDFYPFSITEKCDKWEAK